MLRLLVVLFTVCEVVTVVASVKLLGGWLTLGLAVAAFWLGTVLLRRQGLRTAESFVRQMQFGQAPMVEAWDGACLMAAAFLFMLPGLFSDFIAVLLLLPFVRQGLKSWLFNSRLTRGNYWFDDKAVPKGQVIDAEWHEIRRD